MAVLLSSTKPPRIALTARQVVGAGNGQVFTSGDASDVTFKDFDQALRFACDVFTKVKPSGASKDKPLQRWLASQVPKIGLILDNNWVRIFVCRWHQALRTHQDFVRYSEIEFERRFHSPANVWKLVPDRLLPGGETVWCAYQPEQLKSVELAASDAGLSIQSCLPCIVAELALLGLTRSDGPLIYISGGDRSNNVCWIEEGRIRDLIVLNREIQEGTPLVDLFLERLQRPPIESVSVLRTQGSRISVLRNLVVWQAPVTATTSFEYPRQEVAA
jgi:hypothetical protein